MIDNSAELTETTVSTIKDIRELVREDNIWKERLGNQGLPIETDAHFLSGDLPDNTDLDPLTGLPIEQGSFRIHIIQLLSHAIQQDIPWALIGSDIDNLKTGNTKYDREFGDMVIKVGTALLTQEIAALKLPPDVIQIVARQTGAADENIVLLLGLSEEELTLLNDEFAQRIEKKITIQDPEFTFSQTTSILTSNSPEVQDHILSAKEYLDENSQGIVYKEYTAMKEIVDNEIKLKKIAKDIARIPTEKLATAQTYEQIRTILIDDLGNSRISEKLLENVITIVTFENYLRSKIAFNSTGEYKEFLEKIGVSENMIPALISDGERKAFYKSLIP